MAYQPRFTFRGFFNAQGVFVSESTPPDEILELWALGTQVYYFEGVGYAVIWTSSRPLHSTDLRGAMIVEAGQGLSTVPGAHPDPAELVVAQAGKLQHLALTSDHLIDPASWLDTSLLKLLQPDDGPEVAVVALRPPPSLAPTIQVLEGVPPLSESAKQVAGSLQSQRAHVESRKSALFDRFKKNGKSGSSIQLPPKLGRQRLSEWMRQTQLAKLVGRQHAVFINRLLKLLDEGDVDEALKYSIPLGSGQTESKGYNWGFLRPRSDLQLSKPGGFSRRLMIGGESLNDLLEKRYRSLVTRFENQHNIDRAAYVLSELLGVPEEAVSLLERHGEYRKAAQMAELKALAPGLVIRQWFIAGETERAILVAYRSGQFADALSRLSADHDQVKALRIAWAGHLAARGDYVGAVDVIWPIEEARIRAQPWLEAGLGSGGETGTRILIKYLELDPPQQSGSAEQLLHWLSTSRSEEVVGPRDRLIRALYLGNPTSHPLLIPVAATLLRSAMCDAGAGRLPDADRNVVQHAARCVGQEVLAADMPQLPNVKPQRKSFLEIGATDRGTRAVCDYVRLPSGKSLVAFGEAGVELRRDRAVNRLEAPADRLVISDNGLRAIALARRNTRWQVTLLHLDSLEVVSFGVIEIDHFSDTFDGAEWFVSRGDRVMALSLTGSSLKVQWQVADIGRVQSLARDEYSLHLLLSTDNDLYIWRYQLPGMMLRVKESIPIDATTIRLLDNGQLLSSEKIESGEDSGSQDDIESNEVRSGSIRHKHWVRVSPEQWTPRILPDETDLVTAKSHTMVIVSLQPPCVHITARENAHHVNVIYRIVLLATRHIQMRLFDDKLHVSDNAGCCICVDPKTAEVLDNIRV